MFVKKYSEVTIVTAEDNKYLKLKNNEDSEKIIGKPIRMIFSNTDIIPEFEEENI